MDAVNVVPCQILGTKFVCDNYGSGQPINFGCQSCFTPQSFLSTLQ